MRIIENSEISRVNKYFKIAREEALKSNFYGLKDGALILKGDLILGRGFDYFKGIAHSEKNAIEDALVNFNKNIIQGSTIYLTRINGNNSIIPLNNPYCLTCSKMALDYGISSWVIFHESGFYEYSAEEYNSLAIKFETSKLKSL